MTQKQLPTIKPILSFLFLCSALAGGIAVAQSELPDIGDSSQSTLSQAGEKELGETFMRELRAQVSVIEDPQIEDYIQDIGYRLASHTQQSAINFTFFVVDSPQINAFAGPGGFIGMNTGLITATESESELASVLAHEIAHVTQRHIARSFELQDRSMVPMLAGLAAAILIGTQNPGAGIATAAAVQGQAIQSMIDFTRANEQEADRVGIQLLADAGLDPRAMPRFFERLNEASRYFTQPPEFLSTHPVTTSRIAESRDRAEAFPYRQISSSNSYNLARAKLQVYAEKSPSEAVKKFEEQIASGKNISDIGAHFGLAVALAEAGDYARAADLTEELITSDPERLVFYDLAAKIEVSRGNPKKAIAIYEDNLELYPDSRILVRGYTEVLIRTGRATDALAEFDRYSKYRPLDSVMHEFAARAHKIIGDTRGAHASLAEHYYLMGQLPQATHQLELAMRAPDSGDYYANAKIEARLEQFKAEEKAREE